MVRPKLARRWKARLRRIMVTLDRWPGWVMALIALACLLAAMWLLTRTHDINAGQPISRTSRPDAVSTVWQGLRDNE
jgi:type VI protein secretion system component VasF